MLETVNGTYPITAPITIDGATRTYTVHFKADQKRLDFDAVSIRLASGEEVTSDTKLVVERLAKRYLFALFEAEASDNSVGTFDRDQRVLVAYYYTIACYLRDDKRVVCDNHSLPILYAAARAIANRTAGMHMAARAQKRPVPNDFDDRVRAELQLIRKERKNNQQLFFDNDRWEFFLSCLGAAFAWRSGKIPSRSLRLALTIMPEYYRRTIREAGGLP